MIFKIVDGRNYFYQWDINRQIEVSDPTIKELHFCNRTDVCSLVVEVVKGIANVPNKLLQSGFNIRVFGYDGQATLHEATFEVKARTQPTDYVYTETEIKRYSDLEARIDEIERNGISEEVINNAVNNYLEENPITMDGYATEEYVNEAVSNVKPDLTGLATESYVDEAVNNAKPDLTDYAKKTDIPDVSKFITSIPSEYITESELEAKGYAKTSALNDKANVNHSHSEYAKTKHTHDMADVNGLQNALNNKASQADIDKAIELHNHNSLYAPIDHSHGDEYASKEHVHSYNNLLDKPTIPSIEGLATEAYVRAAVANVEIPDLTGYATEEYVDNAISNIGIPEGGDVDLSNYYTKEEVDTQIDATTKFETIMVRKDRTDGYYYVKEEDASKIYHNPLRYKLNFLNDDYSYDRSYQTSGAVVNLLFTAHSFESDSMGAPISGSKDIVIKTIKISTDNRIDGNYIVTEITNIDLASKDYVSEAISNINIPEADLTNYYTKEETNAAIQAALNAIGVAEGGAY